MTHQLGFFPSGERILADAGDARVLYVPDVFTTDECEHYFTALRDGLTWTEGTMWMYDHEVDVPRLTAHFGAGEALPDPLGAMLERVTERLAAPFNAVGLNLYRDGRDSVAWHSDKNEHLIEHPTVAVISLGSTRAMQIRPKDPPRRTIAIDLEPGSALVMDGKAQERFEHCVPKEARIATPRMSVVFRTKAL